MRSYRHASVAMAALLFGTLLAGCGPKGQDCAFPALSISVPGPEELLYPIPGATGVPVTAGDVILAYALRGQLYVQSSSGTVVDTSTTTAVPSPLPTPIATSPYSNFVPVAVALPALKPSTAYSVLLVTSDPGYPGCLNAPPPSQSTTTLGTFTTGG